MAIIGTMQGRLVPPEGGRFQSFPREGWKKEFSLAREAELDAIEWIYDAYGEDVNPLGSDAGIAEMRALSAEHGVQVISLCADYFMDCPFLRCPPGEREDLVRRMHWLLGRCRIAGIASMVIPFVDHSRIHSDEEADEVIRLMEKILPAAEANQVELHLETSLPPAHFAQLLERCPHPLLKANYDSGNSSSLGYDCAEEFAAYGKRIGSVHIKDRVLGGGTVPLGTGNANLPAVLEGLAALSYPGYYLLQIARPEQGHEVAWLANNRAYVAGEIERCARKEVSL